MATPRAVTGCLHVVRQDFGAQVAARIARELVVPPHRDGPPRHSRPNAVRDAGRGPVPVISPR
jgi:transcriptional regulator GlxA family with amidase domain